MSSIGPRVLTLKLSSALAASILLGDFSACKMPGIVNPSLSSVFGYFSRIVSAIADIVDSSRESVSLVLPRGIYFRELSCFFYLLRQLGECGVSALHLLVCPCSTTIVLGVHRSSYGLLQSLGARSGSGAAVRWRTPVLARQGLLRQTHGLLATWCI